MLGLTSGADSLSGEPARAVEANETPATSHRQPAAAMDLRMGKLTVPGSAIIDRIAACGVNLGEMGRVRVGDSDWAARVPTDVPVPQAGARLRIEGVDGTVLTVRPEG